MKRGDVYSCQLAQPGWTRLELLEDVDGNVVEAKPLEPLPHWNKDVKCMIRVEELLAKYEMEGREQLPLFASG